MYQALIGSAALSPNLNAKGNTVIVTDHETGPFCWDGDYLIQDIEMNAEGAAIRWFKAGTLWTGPGPIFAVGMDKGTVFGPVQNTYRIQAGHRTLFFALVPVPDGGQWIAEDEPAGMDRVWICTHEQRVNQWVGLDHRVSQEAHRETFVVPLREDRHTCRARSNTLAGNFVGQ